MWIVTQEAGGCKQNPHGFNSLLPCAGPRKIRIRHPERENNLLQRLQHVCVRQIRIPCQRFRALHHSQAGPQSAQHSALSLYLHPQFSQCTSLTLILPVRLLICHYAFVQMTTASEQYTDVMSADTPLVGFGMGEAIKESAQQRSCVEVTTRSCTAGGPFGCW